MALGNTSREQIFNNPKLNPKKPKEPAENAKTIRAFFAKIGAFLVYSVLLYICFLLFEQKFHTPSFTYFDSFKISLGIYALGRLFRS